MHIGTSSSSVQGGHGRCSWRVGKTPHAPEREGEYFWRRLRGGRSQSAVCGCKERGEKSIVGSMFMRS